MPPSGCIMRPLGCLDLRSTAALWRHNATLWQHNVSLWRHNFRYPSGRGAIILHYTANCSYLILPGVNKRFMEFPSLCLGDSIAEVKGEKFLAQKTN